MKTYLFGDIQGCYDDLMALLDKINYDPSCNRLGFAGDLINRGPKSLETLRFIKSTQNTFTVLGNHDLYLLFLNYNTHHEHYKKFKTLKQVFEAPDKQELLDWLRQQPLLIHDTENNYVMTHAGIPPCWNLDQAKRHANEVETILRGDSFIDFLKQLEGNKPEIWSDDLTGIDRSRYIVNALTRMRFVKPDGTLDLDNKSEIASAGFQPWFDCLDSSFKDLRVIFGHWASLMGKTNLANVIGLDTGCVWGNYLTAYCVETREMFQQAKI